MRPFIFPFIGVTAFVFMLPGCTSPSAPPAQPDGSALYATYCVSCHGDKGTNDREGANKAMRLLAANGLSNDAWSTLVAQGRGEMPAFHDRLSPEELHSLRTYILGLR